MKPILKLFIVVNLTCNLTGLKLRKDVIQIVEPNSQETSVASIKMSPYMNTVENASPLQSQKTEKNVIDIYNSNTSNAPDIIEYPKTAQIVTPHVDFITKSIAYSQKEEPAILGSITDTSTITSIDKKTGEVAQDVIKKQKPIIGPISKNEELIKTDKVSYDVLRNTFHEGTSTVSIPVHQ